jgi:hypothetical protein
MCALWHTTATPQEIVKMPATARLTVHDFTEGILRNGAPMVAELFIGMRVQTTRPIDLSPHAQIEAGERGVVAFVDLELGIVEIRMGLMHWGLAEWHNCMWLCFNRTDEVLTELTCL